MAIEEWVDSLLAATAADETAKPYERSAHAFIEYQPVTAHMPPLYALPPHAAARRQVQCLNRCVIGVRRKIG